MLFKNLKEYLAVVIFTRLMVLLPVISAIIFPICLIYGQVTRYLALGYLIHMIYDCWFNYGVSKPHKWWQEGFMHRYARSYFPAKIAPNVSKIPYGHNYIIGVHPHGLYAFGTLNMVANREEEDFKRVYGNRKVALCTAPFNMKIPLQRNFFKFSGSICASEQSITRYLTAAKSDQIALLIIGGAKEATLMTPKQHRIFIMKRKGFCRIALKTGTYLIPTYSFGENEVWDTIIPEPGTFLHKFQQFVLKYFQIGLPILKFPFIFAMPRRIPITVVYGKPIPVKKVENPTKEEINALHAKYVQELIKIFDINKAITYAYHCELKPLQAATKFSKNLSCKLGRNSITTCVMLLMIISS